jgi:hypothetical protein
MKPADFVVDIHSGDNNEMLRHYVVYYASRFPCTNPDDVL